MIFNVGVFYVALRCVLGFFLSFNGPFLPFSAFNSVEAKRGAAAPTSDRKENFWQSETNERS